MPTGKQVPARLKAQEVVKANLNKDLIADLQNIPAATTTAPGAMSAGDKGKLDTVSPGASIASVSVSAPITNSGSATAPNIGVSPATTTTPGTISAADQGKLNGIGAGARLVNIAVTDPISFAGTTTVPNIGIYPATTTLPGSMSAADKGKLDGLGGSAPSPYIDTNGWSINYEYSGKKRARNSFTVSAPAGAEVVLLSAIALPVGFSLDSVYVYFNWEGRGTGTGGSNSPQRHHVVYRPQLSQITGYSIVAGVNFSVNMASLAFWIEMVEV